MNNTQNITPIIPTPGTLIKQKREERNMSRGELAQVTNIALRDIEYLEKDEYMHLPAEIYVKGFLERCAFALGMPASDLLRIYKKKEADFAQKNYIKKLYVNHELIITPKIIFVFMTIFIGAAIGFYFWFQLSYLLSSPFLVVTSPKGDIIVSEDFTHILGHTQRESRIFINDYEIDINGKGFFNNAFALQNGINIIEIKSVNKFGLENIIMRRIIKQ